MGSETPGDLAAALAALRPEIRGMLAEDLPIDLREALAARARDDWPNLRDKVHRMKGSASFCRLETLRQICSGIEDDLAVGDPPDDASMGRLSAEIDRILSRLQV